MIFAYVKNRVYLLVAIIIIVFFCFFYKILPISIAYFKAIRRCVHIFVQCYHQLPMMGHALVDPSIM